MKPLLLAGSLTLITAFGQAQSFVLKFEKIGISKGLSHNIVRSAIEDRDHNLWIATDGGLDFYNGFQVREFTANNSALKSDVIRLVHLLSDGRLIINTAKEDQFMNPEGMYIMNAGMQIDRLPGFDADPITLNNTDQGFYGDAFYVINKDQLWGYAVPEDTWTKQNLPDGFHPLQIADGFILGERNGQRAIVHVLRSEKIISGFDLPQMDSAFAAVYSAYDTIFQFGGLYSFKNSVYDPWRRLVWSWKSNALMATDKHGNVMSLNGSSRQLAFDHQLQSIALTSNGLLMLSTYDGLYLVRASPLNFTTHQLLLPDRRNEGRRVTSARGICVADHFLYINMDHYFVRQNLLTSAPAEILYASDPNKLFALYDDGPAIWFGRQQLFRFDKKKQQITIVQNQLPGTGGLWSMYHNKPLYFLGGQNGVFVFDSSGLMGDNFRTNCKTLDAGQFQVVYQIADTRQGLFYVASNGLFSASPDPCHPVPMSIFFRNGNRCAVSHFTHLYEDPDSTFWLTSKDGGVLHLQLKDFSAEILDILDRSNGLPTNTAYAIYPDTFGNMWISTDQGIIRYEKQTQSFTRYTMEDGLPDNEFNRTSHFQDTDGRIFFGGVGGVVSFRPEDFNSASNSADSLRWVKITQFIAWDDTIVDVTAEAAQQNRIIFHPGDKFIRFEVGLNDLFRTGEQEYEYRIPDINAEWEHMQANVLSIHMLPYGKHPLEIRARNADGQFTQQAFGLMIVSRRPIFLRWWFLLLVTGGGVLAIREYWLSRTRRTWERAAQLEEEVRERTATISRQADELRDLQKMRSRFFANISHELRTPLTLIRGPVQSLLGRTQTREDHEYLEMIRQNALSLGERIDDLLLLSRMDAQKVSIDNENFNLSAFLERILDLFRSGGMEKNLQLDLVNALDATLNIRSDRKKLEHILSNFLSNAIKFTPRHGRIVIKADVEGSELRIAVEDNGPGVDAADAEKVFDRFYQVRSADQVHTGTGIGLAICKELAQVMQGTVGLLSTPGQGSTFFVRIPFMPVDDVQQETGHDEEHVPPDDTVISVSPKPDADAMIMIVEDNPSMRSFLQKELSLYRIAVAENGQQALDMLDRLLSSGRLPDCIISDVMMPVMDGFEMVKKIKEDPALNSIPVIMLTARAGLEDKLAGLRIGVDDYIPKPFDIRELNARLQNIISRIPEKTEEKEEADGPKGVDQLWLASLEQQVLANLSQTDFTMDQLADTLYISRRQMYRRIKQYTGLPANGYVREVRLCEARRICEDRAVATVAELAYSVGFEDPDYFSRIFFQRFGYRPSERL